jgi:hypothetical protein
MAPLSASWSPLFHRWKQRARFQHTLPQVSDGEPPDGERIKRPSSRDGHEKLADTRADKTVAAVHQFAVAGTGVRTKSRQACWSSRRSPAR